MRIQSLQILVEKLIEGGFIIETQALQSSRMSHEQIIEIGDTGPLAAGNVTEEGSATFYLELVRQAKFSWLLFDASLIQIWYKQRAGVVTGHRYCYIPAPFRIDLRQEQNVLHLPDLMEGRVSHEPLDQPRRTILRF